MRDSIARNDRRRRLGEIFWTAASLSLGITIGSAALIWLVYLWLGPSAF